MKASLDTMLEGQGGQQKRQHRSRNDSEPPPTTFPPSYPGDAEERVRVPDCWGGVSWTSAIGGGTRTGEDPQAASPMRWLGGRGGLRKGSGGSGVTVLLLLASPKSRRCQSTHTHTAPLRQFLPLSSSAPEFSPRLRPHPPARLRINSTPARAAALSTSFDNSFIQFP